MAPSSSVINFLKSLKEMTPSSSSDSMKMKTPSSSGSMKMMIPSNTEKIMNIILIFREQEEIKAMAEAIKKVADSLGLDVSLKSFTCPWKALLDTGVMTFYCCIEHELMLPTQVDAVLTDDYHFETFSLLVETYDYRSWLLNTEAHRFSSREAKSLVKRMEVSPRSLQNMFYNKLYHDSAAYQEYLMDRIRYILDPSRERMGHWSMLRTDPMRESLRVLYTQEDLSHVFEKRDRWYAEKFQGLEIDGDNDLGGLGSLELVNQMYGGGDEGADQE